MATLPRGVGTAIAELQNFIAACGLQKTAGSFGNWSINYMSEYGVVYESKKSDYELFACDKSGLIIWEY
ncbi:hypothetical protein OGM63_25250 [Plectonema radiosum NIES-515]|uniref:Uncharacterized protein n=1 Tax=Plectonema radiosum NIES-515 TaxID=2986073 RepID=A0ABT3B5W9_9CYAN|nr:hypothetical protein [Plectonema radiosum]MCV3216771.1 hypothetical protein [Plectonema radiosum NIES-515]